MNALRGLYIVVIYTQYCPIDAMPSSDRSRRFHAGVTGRVACPIEAPWHRETVLLLLWSCRRVRQPPSPRPRVLGPWLLSAPGCRSFLRGADFWCTRIPAGTRKTAERRSLLSVRPPTGGLVLAGWGPRPQGQRAALEAAGSTRAPCWSSRARRAPWASCSCPSSRSAGAHHMASPPHCGWITPLSAHPRTLEPTPQAPLHRRRPRSAGL